MYNIHHHIDVSGAWLKRSPTVGYLPHKFKGIRNNRSRCMRAVATGVYLQNKMGEYNRLMDI